MNANILQTPIDYLKGVGPNRADLLRKELGIHTYQDLVNFFPNRYLDKTRFYKINELQRNSAEVQVVGKITHIRWKKYHSLRVPDITQLCLQCTLHMYISQMYFPSKIWAKTKRCSWQTGERSLWAVLSPPPLNFGLGKTLRLSQNPHGFSHIPRTL